jgi:hypothetical protein
VANGFVRGEALDIADESVLRAAQPKRLLRQYRHIPTNED